MDKIRIGLVGTGFIADYHARAVNARPETELTAVISRKPNTGKAFAERHQCENTFLSPTACLEKGIVDALVLCTPNAHHYPDTLLALQSGIHVLVEKPLACTAAQAEEMKAAAKKAGRILMTGHMWRFDPEALYIRRLIAEGNLGKIYRTKGYGVHVNWGPAGWFTQKTLAGGGALADMGIHALDTARFLLGDPAPVAVFARVETLFKDYDVDDTGTLLVTWENGCVSYIESGWWQPHADGPEAATRLYGTGGYASLFPTESVQSIGGLTNRCNPDVPARTEHCGQQLYTDQMAAFAGAIMGEGDSDFLADIGVVMVRIVEAAIKSSVTGKAVQLTKND
jgi:predicted dehydrogenase